MILFPDGGIQMFQSLPSPQPPGEGTLTEGDIRYWHFHSALLGKLEGFIKHLRNVIEFRWWQIHGHLI